MAYSLFGERPDTAAASSINPVRAFALWIAAARARRSKRVALASLLDYDDALLCDLGIDRSDVIDALQSSPRRAAQALSARRAKASRAWLSP